MKELSLLLVLSCSLSACQGSGKQATPAPSANAASAVSAAPSASAAPVAPAVWHAGSWQGSYKAELHRIELPAGGIREWKKDDGAQSSGEGKLSLEVTPAGDVSGKASGALGEQIVTGRVEGERVALSLAPVAPGGFQGTIVAAQAPEGIKGALSASTGDSVVVRKAEVVLAKAAK